MSVYIQISKEHTPEKGSIEITYAENPVYTLISVADSGSGIDLEDLPYIFNRFYKGKNAGDDSVGIGLAMSVRGFRFRPVLINQPALVLTDEPTGNLDSKNSREIIDLLKLSNKCYNQTLIMITHDHQVALQADRVITLDDGRIVHDEVI